MRARFAVPLAALILALAACTQKPTTSPTTGASTPAPATPTATATATASPTATGTTPTVGISVVPTLGATVTPTAPKGAVGPYTTIQTAEAYVSKQADTGFPFSFIGQDLTWRPAAILHVLHATPQGTASYGGDYYYFFVNGNPVGTRYFTQAVRETGVDPSTFSITYTVYKPGDPHCCPAGGQATVRFRWDGSRLSPLDPMPGATQS